MLNVRDEIIAAVSEQRRVIVATIISIAGSSPSPLGTSMVLIPTGQREDLVAGTVTSFTASTTLTGGCIESAVMELAQEVLATGTPVRATYGISDDDAFAVGLMCGGRVTVLIQSVDGGSIVLAEQLQQSRLAIVVDGPDEWLGFAVPGLSDVPPSDRSGIVRQLATVAAGTLDSTPRLSVVECDDVTLTLLTAADLQPPRMYIFGAVDYAVALSTLASDIGYEVVVCDPRETFTTTTRFPHARVVVQWPHRFLAEEITRRHIDDATVLCILTHDLKFDVPLLSLALSTEAGYIGAMGSRRTQQLRRDRLIAEGTPESAWDRIHAPIGLDLGATSPEETAVSILAEIIACRHAASGESLRKGSGPIHRPTGV